MRPVMLAIVGDSAAGKTTFAEGVVQLVGPDRVATLCTDDYHRYDRAQRRELDITPLDPACNYMDILAQHLRLLWKRMDFDHHLERDDIGLFVEGNRCRHSDPLAIAQLFIAYHLLNEAAGGGEGRSRR